MHKGVPRACYHYQYPINGTDGVEFKRRVFVRTPLNGDFFGLMLASFARRKWGDFYVLGLPIPAGARRWQQWALVVP